MRKLKYARLDVQFHKCIHCCDVDIATVSICLPLSDMPLSIQHLVFEEINASRYEANNWKGSWLIWTFPFSSSGYSHCHSRQQSGHGEGSPTRRYRKLVQLWPPQAKVTKHKPTAGELLFYLWVTFLSVLFMLDLISTIIFYPQPFLFINFIFLRR